MARVIRSWFKKESLPICFLADSDVNSSAGAVADASLLVEGLRILLVEGAKADAVASRRAAIERWTILFVCMC